jgi:hypothetical protein
MIKKSSKLFKMGKVRAKYYGAVKHCVLATVLVTIELILHELYENRRSLLLRIHLKK